MKQVCHVPFEHNVDRVKGWYQLVHVSTASIQFCPSEFLYVDLSSDMVILPFFQALELELDARAVLYEYSHGQGRVGPAKDQVAGEEHHWQP